MLNFILTIIFGLACLFTSSPQAATLDAPHNSANGISCSSCHTYSAWWQYSPAPPNTPAYGQAANAICLTCHDSNSSSPYMGSHSSTVLSESHGIWERYCIDCHDPHNQRQLEWLGTWSNELYLVSGNITTIDNGDGSFSYSYTDNGNNTTTINIDSGATAAKSGWQDPATWSSKNDNPLFARGLILVHSRSQAYNTYSVISATAASITIAGLFEPGSTDPNTDNDFGLIYGQLIRSTITAGTTTAPNTDIAKDVKFFDPGILFNQGGFTDPNTPAQGICQVCHLNTTYWTEDGANNGHNAGILCTSCHLRAEGFKPSGDGHPNGTFAWDNSCTSCHNPDDTAEIINDVHKVGSGNSCTMCHLDESGGALDLTTSAANATIGTLPHLCSECHLDPDNQHHTTSKAQAGDCAWCHPDPRTTWQTTFGISGSMPRQLACRECHVKTDGTGLTIYKLDFPVTTNDTITFPGGDLSQEPDNSKTVIQTAMDGTNGTTNHQINGPAKIEIYNFGICFSCHNGNTATAVNVWHARPKYGEIPTDSSIDAYRMHFDTLRYAPGRSKFNLWRGDGHQNEPYFSHSNDFYDDGNVDAATRGEDFFDDQRGRNNIQWNWGVVSEPYSMLQIPCFQTNGQGNDLENLCGENSGAAQELVPVFDNGPTRDNITVVRANYANNTVSIEAVNTNGDLSITYDNSNIGPMTGNSGAAWNISFPLAALTTSRVDIITSNPLGTNAVNYPLCLDPITIVSAEWDPKNANTITILADNIAGDNATLSVTDYIGSNYIMENIGANHWQLIRSGVEFQTAVTISNNCDTVTGQVTDLTDSITITKAEWDPANTGLELTVWAENSSPPATLLVDYGSTTNMPMTWNSSAGRWEIDLPAPDYNPFVRIHSDYLGDSTISVISQGELIQFGQAHFDNLDQTITVQAINELGSGVSVFADYNGTTYAMTNVGGSRWELQAQGVSAYLDNMTIWSTGGGNLNILVNQCATPTWPPASSGTYLNAGVYWNRSDFDPDRLQVNINVGQDVGVPRLILNGSATPVEYPCIHTEQELPGVYKCEIDDNSLAGAGYDPWLVVYSGAYPGAASVLNFTVNDWSQDQLNIQSINISSTGLALCPAAEWDVISQGSAIWDGSDLIVSASNNWQDATIMQTEYNALNYNLTWNSSENLWQGTISSVPLAPTADLSTMAGGYLSRPVADLTQTPDIITITNAGWNADAAGSLTVNANNTYSDLVTLTAVYNGTTSPMTWTGNTWQLQNITGTTLPPEITITSNAPAGGSATVSPVADLTPAPYPPACGSGNGMDKITTPLDKAHFDPSKGDELHVKLKNAINLSYGARFFMTYSETVASQTVYEIPWSSDFTFEHKVGGFTWSPGATVTIWSENDANEVMDIACNQPVMHKDLLDTITITKAEWLPASGTLTVWAENSSTASQVYLDYHTHIAQPMTWNAAANHWELTITGTPYSNTVRVYSDTNGDATAQVLDLVTDTITVQEAYWKLDITKGNLYIRADNTLGHTNQLFADIGTQTDLAMTWDIQENSWKLLINQVDLPASIRIWSLRPGETVTTVTDLSGSHTKVTADSQCLACHPSTDILFTIHLAKCATCHASSIPAVIDAVNTGNGGSCITCHQPITTRVRMTEVSFNFSGSNAIAMKDHNRPNSDILIPVPEYLLDTRNEPAAYAKGSTIDIQVVFKADSGINSATIGTSLFAPQLVNFTAGISAPVTYTLPSSVSDSVGIKALTLDWSYCDENGSNIPDCAIPEILHDSHHKLYITHNTPTAAPPFFAALVEYSTNWSADAASEQEIVDNIYDGIWTLGAYGYRYQYPFLARTGTRVGDILRYQAGACGEWAAFLQRGLEIQGVDVYVVDIVPDQLDSMVMITDSIGNNQETYLFGDHAFVVYGVPYIQSVVPTLGTAYDPSFHHTGPGWGGYEDVIIPYLEEKDIWYPNNGFGNGPGDDVLDTKIREVTDDFIIDESQL